MNTYEIENKVGSIENDPMKLRLARGEITKVAYLELLRLLSE